MGLMYGFWGLILMGGYIALLVLTVMLMIYGIKALKIYIRKNSDI